MKPNNDLFQAHYVILNRQSFILENQMQCSHYNLILNNNSNVNLIISKTSQQFERNMKNPLTNKDLTNVSKSF